LPENESVRDLLNDVKTLFKNNAEKIESGGKEQ
jgi:hypothetical protein